MLSFSGTVNRVEFAVAAAVLLLLSWVFLEYSYPWLSSGISGAILIALSWPLFWMFRLRLRDTNAIKFVPLASLVIAIVVLWNLYLIYDLNWGQTDLAPWRVGLYWFPVMGGLLLCMFPFALLPSSNKTNNPGPNLNEAPK